jgi:hypothetical protein
MQTFSMEGIAEHFSRRHCTAILLVKIKKMQVLWPSCRLFKFVTKVGLEDLVAVLYRSKQIKSIFFMIIHNDS